LFIGAMAIRLLRMIPGRPLRRHGQRR
jgi:hypothetical protein